jgi:hypothetical protein
MLSKQEEAQERRAVLENDRRVREQQQSSTNLDHARAAANDTGGGRFASLGAPHVVGSTPIPKYPQAGPAFQVDPVGDEPPLAFDNPALANPTGVPPVTSPVDPGPVSDTAPLSDLADDEQRPGAGPLSHKD